MFDRTTNDCKLFSGSVEDLQNDCREVGYASQPAFDECNAIFDDMSENGCYVSKGICKLNVCLVDIIRNVEGVNLKY